MPGPIPARSDRRRRRNKPEIEMAQESAGEPVVWEDPNPEWHPIATRWYESLAKSGQAIYYEQSDVWTAYYVAEAMSRNLTENRFSAMLFSSVMASMTQLLTTEGARRRARVELQRESDSPSEEPVNLAVVQGEIAAG